MKILFLAPAGNYHTQKWCNYFVSRKYEVHVISLTSGSIPNVNIHLVNNKIGVSDSDVKKLRYLFTVKIVKNLIKKINPDIISVHYASSYGTLAALSLEKKYSLSVWGTDIYQFPTKSIFHKLLLKYSLKKAELLMSTSVAMSKEGNKYTNRQFIITPFGVDLNIFNPTKRNRNDNYFVIGNIKSLSEEYGIDILLEASAIIKKDRPDIPLKIKIAGRGPKEESYKKYSHQLGIEKDVCWLGFITQEEAAVEWANFDLAVIPSRRESFGVSAVEAQACGLPVVISDVEGLKEATLPGVSSIVLEKNNAEQLAKAVIKLFDDEKLRRKMGINGREYVSKNFEYNSCFKKIENTLLSLL